MTKDYPCEYPQPPPRLLRRRLVRWRDDGLVVILLMFPGIRLISARSAAVREGNAATPTKCVPVTACYMARSASVLYITCVTCFTVHRLGLESFLYPCTLWRVPGRGRHRPAPQVSGSQGPLAELLGHLPVLPNPDSVFATTHCLIYLPFTSAMSLIDLFLVL